MKRWPGYKAMEKWAKDPKNRIAVSRETYDLCESLANDVDKLSERTGMRFDIYSDKFMNVYAMKEFTKGAYFYTGILLTGCVLAVVEEVYGDQIKVKARELWNKVKRKKPEKKKP